MTSLQELIGDKDSVAGKIVKIFILGKALDFDSSQAFVFKFLLDGGEKVFAQATMDYLDVLMERKEKTATFIGKFVENDHKKLECESIVFWSDETNYLQ
jgi:hypothetical protein